MFNIGLIIINGKGNKTKQNGILPRLILYLFSFIFKVGDLFSDCFLRFPQQKSNEIFLSKCRLYRMEMLMKQDAGRDSASVGIRLPNGSYERPIGNNRLFWVLPGKCSLKR